MTSTGVPRRHVFFFFALTYCSVLQGLWFFLAWCFCSAFFGFYFFCVFTACIHGEKRRGGHDIPESHRHHPRATEGSGGGGASRVRCGAGILRGASFFARPESVHGGGPAV